MPLVLLLLVIGGAVSPAPAGAAARWIWPVRGDVLTRFHVGPNPFAGGQHRGVDIAAAAGERVRSACAGKVRFAGRVPGRGRVVTVVCDALVATYLELGETAVEKGEVVQPGALVGRVAASHLQLGARRAGSPFGYLDPLKLLAPDRAPAPPRAVPLPRRGPRAPAAVRRPIAPPAPAPSPSPSRAPAGIPLPAWLGLALLAAGTPVGAVWRRRRGRARTAAATA